MRFAVLAAALGALVLPPSAGAFIYWANTGTTIGRANPDGSGANQNFLASGQACGVAVDRSHIYWTGNANGMIGVGTIGRANLDGTAPEPNFISGASNPCGVAVDGAHIYWSDTVAAGGIGRANLDGTGVNQSFAATDGYACGVAVDGSHLYWANRDAGTIGRANLDGNLASVDQSFIAGGTDICGVAVDGAHVYWADRESDSIGRADLDGNAASVNPKFISGASNPCGLAVDSSHVYWANSLSSAIGSANLDGSGVNQNLIAANIPCMVAADLPPLPPPGPPDTTITRFKVKHKARRARFIFTGSGGNGALSFQCKLDKKPFGVCTSPKRYKNLPPGKHKFAVRAVDAAGQIDSTPASQRFRIPKKKHKRHKKIHK